MQFSEWEPIYLELISDMGFDRAEDENSVRLLKALTVNSDLIMDDELKQIIGKEVTVFGNSENLESDIRVKPPRGTLIASGSAVGRVISAGYFPDIEVTDLDGDIGPQLESNRKGTVALLHAHGDNGDLIRSYAKCFEGPVILTTQSSPEHTVSDFGGFTDGDRAVCLARHFGAKNILLLGFDFDRPHMMNGSDDKTNRKKLRWAERIIRDCNDPDVVLEFP